MFPVVLAVGLIGALGAAGLFAKWLLRPSAEAEDGDEETIWVDVREWLMLDRLFGARPPRLTYKAEEPPPGA